MDAEHPQVREQLADSEQSFDQTVAEAADRALGRPGSHLIRILGERPDQQRTAERASWDRAAGAVERYRIAHNLDPAEESALGLEPEPGWGRWKQIGAWRKAGESVLDEQTYGPAKERLARIDRLIPDADR